MDALGPFDLDPCACIPQPWPCAKKSYTRKDNGLIQPWEGLIWLNPPYGNATKVWLKKLTLHSRGGMALLHARVDTDMFRDFVWKRAVGIFFIHRRLRFFKPDGTQGPYRAHVPSVLVAYCTEAAERLLNLSPDICAGQYINLRRC